MAGLTPPAPGSGAAGAPLRPVGAQAEDAGQVIVSYPKTGRTWLRALLGKALVDHYRLPPDLLLDTRVVTALAGLPMTSFLHDDGGMMRALTWDRITRDKSAYAGKRVLLLARDVRDTLVSAYFQATRRIGVFDGPISAFVRDDRFGARKVAAFYRAWYDARHVPAALLFMRYEAIHDDPAAALRRTLAFLGARDVPAPVIAAAVEFSRFENLRRAEADGRYPGPILRAEGSQDPDGFKVRRGKVGGFREYLSDDDVAFIDARVAESGCPFISPAR
jgi:hypothetical protein